MFRFTSANVISISVYSVQLVVGLVANLCSLLYLLRERLILHNKNRMVLLLIHLTCADLIVSLNCTPAIYIVIVIMSYPEMILLQMNPQSLIFLVQVILIGIPLEIAWTATVSWWADWLTCKVMVFLRIFGYFISGNVLMAISIDRFSATVFPILHRSSSRLTRLLLGLAWTLAALCSIPQSIVFSLETHPVVRSYRCFFVMCNLINLFAVSFDL